MQRGRKVIDISGSIFGQLTVIEPVKRAPKKINKNKLRDYPETKWLCKCSCGNLTEATKGNLKSNNTTSCGCKKRGVKIEDLTGQTIGRMFVESMVPRKEYKTGVSWNCICSCGKKKIMSSSGLKTSKVPSCGCYKKETLSKKIFKHGLSKHPLYFRWHTMIYRCTKKNHPQYKDYGGRGITVCQEWMDVNVFFRLVYQKWVSSRVGNR